MLDQARRIQPDHPLVRSFAEKFQRVVDTKVEKHIRSGWFYTENNKVPLAIQQFKRVLIFDPTNEEALKAIKDLQKVDQKVQKLRQRGVVAPTSSGRSHDLNFLSAFDLVNRARLAYQKGEVELALKRIEEALQREPNYKEALRLREKINEYLAAKNAIASVRNLLDKQRAREAVDTLDRLIAKFPDRVDLLLMRIRGLIALKSYRRAGLDLKAALKLGVPVRKLLPYHVQIYAGKGDSLRACAVSATMKDVSWFEWLGLYVACYPFQLGIFFLVVIAVFVAAWFAWKQADEFFGRCRFGTLLRVVKALGACRSFGAVSQVGELDSLANELGLPWLHYLAGMGLLLQGFAKQSQKHFQNAVASPGLACAAYFFLGVTRRKLKQELADHDFDQAMLLGLQGFHRTWRPGYVRQLENQVLLEVAPGENVPEQESYSMAFLVVQGYVG